VLVASDWRLQLQELQCSELVVVLEELQVALWRVAMVVEALLPTTKMVKRERLTLVEVLVVLVLTRPIAVVLVALES
jgi:hypothetical protein